MKEIVDVLWNAPPITILIIGSLILIGIGLLND